MAKLPRSANAAKPSRKPIKSPADPDASLLDRLHSYRLNRLQFELALAESVTENQSEET
jgi:hypothetical protein